MLLGMRRTFFGQTYRKAWTADTVRRWHILCYSQVFVRHVGHDVNLFVTQDNGDSSPGRVERQLYCSQVKDVLYIIRGSTTLGSDTMTSEPMSDESVRVNLYGITFAFLKRSVKRMQIITLLSNLYVLTMS